MIPSCSSVELVSLELPVVFSSFSVGNSVVAQEKNFEDNNENFLHNLLMWYRTGQNLLLYLIWWLIHLVSISGWCWCTWCSSFVWHRTGLFCMYRLMSFRCHMCWHMLCFSIHFWFHTNIRVIDITNAGTTSIKWKRINT